MKLEITHSPHHSRIQLLLRATLGMVFIALPHALALIPLAVVSLLLMPVAWVSILFTGHYPASLFDFEVGLLRWQLRANARLNNLVDGYPAFGLKAIDGNVELTISRPDRFSRGHLLLKLLLGWLYCGIPHAFVLIPRALLTAMLMALAFIAVLITGKYPSPWHRFNVGTMRHVLRVRLYMGGMTDTYPAFR